MVETVETWGLPVALDLFFAGLGAGSFCFSVLASRQKGAAFDACARGAAILTPLSLGFGLAMLVLDLMYKTRFWFTMRLFNVDSPMSFGVWLLTIFASISLVHALFWIPDPLRVKVPLIGRWTFWQNAAYRRSLGLLGIPFALAVSVYTGVLLSVSSLPLWRNIALPALFCFSALATGFAAAGLIALALGPRELMEQPIHWLRSGYRVMLPVYLAVGLLFTFLAYRSTSWDQLRHLVAGQIGAWWWAGVVGVGIVLPSVLVMTGTMNRRKFSVVLLALLAGGFLLRMLLMLAGQAAV